MHASSGGARPAAAMEIGAISSVMAAIALLVLIALVCIPAPAAAGDRGTMLLDFESGTVDLFSYEDEDYDPDAWEVQSQDTYGTSQYALRLWGNTWKECALDPYAIETATVLRAAMKSASQGEIQAIGFGDGSENVLFYVFSGSQNMLSDRWNVVYRGAFPQEEWHAYLLPLGQDWYDTWGYVPTITRLVFVNDRDDTPHGETLFDEIYDVTDELAVAPQVTAQALPGRAQRMEGERSASGDALYRIDVQFLSQVYDPDSNSHDYLWDFGDGTYSEEANPTHTFTAEADYTFTVALDVVDDTGLFGRDAIQVAVEPGSGGGLLSLNFAGDIFLGRNYEQPGGLIDTYGAEYLFEPTLGMLGEDADVTWTNAECPFTDQGVPHPTKSVVFRTRPENIVGLTYAGIDVASLGNNHIWDYLDEGLIQTQEVFTEAGIAWGGSGVNAYLAEQPTYYSIDGVRLAFINACNRTGREYNWIPFLDAGYEKAGFAYWTRPMLERAMAQADSLADILIACPHSGIEYETAPEPELLSGGHPIAEPGRFAPGGHPWAGPGRFDPGDHPWAGSVWAAGGHPGTESEGLGGDPRFADPELSVPSASAGDIPDVRFRIWPGMTDRELRWHAVDLGADAVINTHPHVLQGFEVYNGVLIAHSLGNFMFDLYYPETMPTIVLRALFDKDGIHRWTFKPVFIDDWIPVPARGRLGHEILARMADYSRELGTLVSIDPTVMTGVVYLDPVQAEPHVTLSTGAQPVYEGETHWMSLPIELAGAGSLSRILDATGVALQDAEVSYGREMLWFGRFEQEEEGHHMWNLNSSGEWIDDTVFYEGAHSLALHRETSSPENVVTLVKRHWPAEAEREYSICGWMKTENARDGMFSLRFYSSRYNWNPIAQHDMDEPVDGTTDWTFYTADCQAPSNAAYLNVRCNLDRPHSGDAYAYFDDLKVIEWLDWEPLVLPHEVPHPNNYRFVRVRLPQAAEAVELTYEETRFTDGGFSSVPEEAPAAREAVSVLHRGASPNPIRGATTLSYRLGASAEVSLEVFDLAGRLVQRLVDHQWQRPGWHRFAWEPSGADAGVYFSRLTVNGDVHARKLVVVR